MSSRAPPAPLPGQLEIDFDARPPQPAEDENDWHTWFMHLPKTPDAKETVDGKPL